MGRVQTPGPATPVSGTYKVEGEACSSAFLYSRYEDLRFVASIVPKYELLHC